MEVDIGGYFGHIWRWACSEVYRFRFWFCDYGEEEIVCLIALGGKDETFLQT